jgi:acyl carrier protein
MHSAILAEAPFRGEAIKRSRLRLICNSAASLRPTLAKQLKDTFHCIILPSYGMTECMPISAPPLDFDLEPPGTVGFACGPEIIIMGRDAQPLGINEIGWVCVRGGPIFGGYLKDNGALQKLLLPGGWFNTWDLGYFDGENHLFLTGRQKEVINRGGELISPLEIEEAILSASQVSNSPLYGRVKEALAFSAPHNVLQEVVGVVLVTNPGRPRPDLRDLQEALKSSLHSSKWPVIIVYMKALPFRNGKPARIKLGERLNLAPISDDTTPAHRHFDAVCPPPNSTLETKIQISKCAFDTDVLLNKLHKNLGADFEVFVCLQHHTGLFELFIAPRINSTGRLSQKLEEVLYSVLCRDLDGYLIPSRTTCIQTPFPKNDVNTIDEGELRRILMNNGPGSRISSSETEFKVRQAIAEVLQLPINMVSPETDFFDIGGNSLSAGRLLSLLRRNLHIRIPVQELFTSSKVRELTKLAERLLAIHEEDSDEKWDKANSEIRSGKTYSSTNPIVLVLQLLPITLFYPLKMALRWSILIYGLIVLKTVWDSPRVASRYASLIAAMVMSRLSVEIASPIFGILFKWIVIGRYKEGLYPMWGVYHTRWWLVQKALMIFNEVWHFLGRVDEKP